MIALVAGGGFEFDNGQAFVDRSKSPSQILAALRLQLQALGVRADAPDLGQTI
jgi:hypothetical protein